VDVGGQCVRRATSARIFGHGIIFFKNPKRFRTLAFLDSDNTSVRLWASLSLVPQTVV
jgi:hypothetical protein